MISEVGGRWQQAEEMPGTAALNTGGNAETESVSCASAGSCTAGGYYTDSRTYRQALVASEADGSWQPAAELPGTAALSQETGSSKGAAVQALSCVSAGTCRAGGYYTGSSGTSQALVASEADGSWQPAEEAPGTAALNKAGAAITSLSCPPAGRCTAAGTYKAAAKRTQVFALSAAGKQP